MLRPCPVALTLYPARRWMSQTCINSCVIKAVLGLGPFILLCNWAISIATNILNPLLKATRCDCELQKILGRWTLTFFVKLLFLRSIKNLGAHRSNFHRHCCCGALTIQFVWRSARKANSVEQWTCRIVSSPLLFECYKWPGTHCWVFFISTPWLSRGDVKSKKPREEVTKRQRHPPF